MNAQPKKTWILSDDLAARVQEMIEEGLVASLDEIVEEGILAIEEQGPPIDDETIRRAVEPVLRELELHPERAIPADQAWAEINAHIARRRGKD